MPEGTATLETPNGDAVLKFKYTWDHPTELHITINYIDFAKFLEATGQPTLASLNLQILIEIENSSGEQITVYLPITNEILYSSSQELRHMELTREPLRFN